MRGDEVVGMQMASQGEYMLVVSEKGYGKRTGISEFKLQLRGGKGLLCYNVTEKTGNLVGMKLLDDGRDIMLITNEGILIRMGVDDISVIGRNTSGVKLMSIDADSMSALLPSRKCVKAAARMRRTKMWKIRNLRKMRTEKSQSDHAHE